MAKRNRSTLRNFFREGALPSADQFGDLIDSSLNTIDEGFDKSLENGFEISSIGSHDTLVSFLRNSSPDSPLWSISYDRDQNKLIFNQIDEDKKITPVLVMTPDQKVGINKKEPEWDLDVAGVVRSQGRIGVASESQPTIPADGEWHTITGPLSGCHAFEVMAGAGNKGTGRYALMHAIAMNTFNPKGIFFNFLNFKKRVKYHHAYYNAMGNRLKVRWIGEGTEYYLQLRSRSDYGDGCQIRYYITDLWFDNVMSGSIPRPEGFGMDQK